MQRRVIPATCAQCGASVPRAAAGRCPFCRADFALTGPGVRPDARAPQTDRAGKPLVARRLSRRLP